MTTMVDTTMPAMVLKPFEDQSVRPFTRREEGDLLHLDPERARRWHREGYVRILDVDESAESWPWDSFDGRQLDSLDQPAHPWGRIVAAVNVWNDRAELERNAPSWLPHVDHVIAVDGAYAGVPTPTAASTDGTLDVLAEMGAEIVPADGFWKDQCVKRTEYFRRGQPGDLFIIIDADEWIIGAERLRQMPLFDAGWFLWTSPLYSRPQGGARVFRWRPDLNYRGRHHWVYAGDVFMASMQQGAAGWDHRVVPVRMENRRGPRRPAVRTKAAAVQRGLQHKSEAGATRNGTVLGSNDGRDALRIAQIARLDAGLAVHRLHSAINVTTPHTSVLGTDRWGDGGWDEPHQFHLREDRPVIRRAITEADILHVHLTLTDLQKMGMRYDVPVVLHHHGTMYRNMGDGARARENGRAAVVLVSNPELLKYDPAATYMPNPVPYARYQRLAAEVHDGAFEFSNSRPMRIAHSPSKRELKGTGVLLRVVDRLNAQGVPVELVLIEGMAHGAALARKAMADVTFDSFWLGMQCSGLEGAAMGQPVIAGDLDNAGWYNRNHGRVPYTFANDEAALRDQLARLATDREFFEGEARRVTEHVMHHHDYAAVTAWYLEVLEHKVGWMSRMVEHRREARRGGN